MQETNHFRLPATVLGLCLGMLACTQPLHADEPGNHDDQESSITAVLEQQTKAWNAGDIDRFMQHYWNSEKLTFSSGGKTLSGWKATKQRYQTRYATPEKMGQLSFGKLQVQPLGPFAAYVLGEWRLDREAGNLRGNFTLIFRRMNEHWVIVHDHTSLLQNDS